jgi:8-amino-7-oxononanoate synthase
MGDLDQFARQKLATLRATGLLREVWDSRRSPGARVERNGRTLISLSCNDYLGLSHDPRVIEAAAAALHTYGAGAGAARLITGAHPLARAFERAIADYLGTEAALLFGSGYLCNLGVIPSLVAEGDLVVLDQRAHASLYAGARSARAEVVTCGPGAGPLERALKRRGEFKNCLVAIEGVHSMDGDRAEVPAIAELATAHDAWLLVDDAHGLGVLEDGKGTCTSGGQRLAVPLQVGTCSKALGSYGGFLAASQGVVELLTSRARSFVYTTALPPMVVAASLAALQILQAEPERTRLPLQKATLFCRALGRPDPQSPIVPLPFGSPERALAAQARLQTAGFLATAIRPPTVPEGTARLRLAFPHALEATDLERLVSAVRGLEVAWPAG